MVVSLDAAVEFLRTTGVKALHACATKSVAEHLVAHGFDLEREAPEAVLLTYNNEIGYEDLRKVVELVRSGVPYYATHIDALYPCEDGFLPDIGCFIDMIAAATGRRPDRQFGKPSIGLVEHILARHGLGPEHSVIVGDRLYTDIALAQENAMLSVLVLSGETKRSQLLDSQVRPDVVLACAADLVDLFA